MHDVRIVAAIKEDVDWLAPRLCELDRQELRLALGDVVPAFKQTYGNAVCAYTIMVDHVPYVMCGINPGGDPRRGVIWCLSCAEARKFPLRFMRYGRMLVDEGLANFAVLENYVYEQNVRSMAWLKRLGAKFERPQPYGVSGAMFKRFTICAK